MARLPAYINRAPLDTGADSFRQTNDGSAQIGQGIAQLGSGVFNAGLSRARMQAGEDIKAEAKAEQAAGWHDELQFRRLREDIDTFAEQHKSKVGEDAEGYTKAVNDYAIKQYDALRSGGALSRKDGLRNDNVFDSIRVNAVKAAESWRIGTQSQFRSRVSEDRIKEELAVVATKGVAGYDEAQTNWTGFVERTMGTQSREGQLMLQFGSKRIERTALEAEATRRGPEFTARFQGVFSETPSANTKNPLVNATLKFAPLLGVDPKAMVAAGWIESRLNHTHDGPKLSPGEAPALGRKGKTHKSSAEGGWQFLDGDVTSAGLSLADKFDPEKSTELMTKRYAANQRTIEGMGQQATPGKLYMMHNVGAGVGSLMLKVDPSTPIEDVFYRANPSNPRQAAQALRNNPSMYRAGQTVGQVLANYERQVGIAMDQTKGYFDGSQSATGEQATALASSFLGRDVKHLSTNDVAEVFVNVSKNVQTASKEESQIAQGAYFLSNPGTADPYDSSHKTAINKAFEAKYGSAIIDGIAAGDSQALKTVVDSTRVTGVMPEKALHGIRTALDSGNTESAMRALMTLHEIDSTNSRALAATGMTADDRDAIDTYRASTGVLGINPAEATKRVMFDRSPEGKKSRAAFAEKFKTEWRNGTSNEVEADTKGWNEVAAHMKKGNWFAPDAIDDTRRENITEAYKQGILYHRLQGRDLPTAKAMALDQIEGSWGKSSASSSKGEEFVTLYPPEKTTPPLDGDHKWVTKQAETILRTHLVHLGKLKYVFERTGVPGVDADAFQERDRTPEFRLVAAPGSAVDFAAGRQVKYNIWYTDSNGMKQIAVGEVFEPNYPEAKRHSEEQFKQRRAERDAAKAKLAQPVGDGPAYLVSP